MQYEAISNHSKTKHVANKQVMLAKSNGNQQRPKDCHLQSKNKLSLKEKQKCAHLGCKEKSTIVFPHKCMTAECTEYSADSLMVRGNGIVLVLLNVIH